MLKRQERVQNKNSENIKESTIWIINISVVHNAFKGSNTLKTIKNKDFLRNKKMKYRSRLLISFRTKSGKESTKKQNFLSKKFRNLFK